MENRCAVLVNEVGQQQLGALFALGSGNRTCCLPSLQLTIVLRSVLHCNCGNAEAMLLVDVDFAVSRSLADLVKGEATYARLMSMLHNRQAACAGSWEILSWAGLTTAAGMHALSGWRLPATNLRIISSLRCWVSSMTCQPTSTYRSTVCCRNAVVLPAFETQDDGEAGRQVALEAVRKGKPYVVNKFE